MKILMRIKVKRKLVQEAEVVLELDESITHQDAAAEARRVATEKGMWVGTHIEEPWMSTHFEVISEVK